jgi:hypothetical protein
MAAHDNSLLDYWAQIDAGDIAVFKDGKCIEVPSEVYSLLRQVFESQKTGGEIGIEFSLPEAIECCVSINPKGLCINKVDAHTYVLHSTLREKLPHIVSVPNPNNRYFDAYECYRMYSYYFCRWCGQEGQCFVSHTVSYPH